MMIPQFYDRQNNIALAGFLALALLLFFSAAVLMGWANQWAPPENWTRSFAFPFSILAALSIASIICGGSYLTKLLFSIFTLMVLAATLAISLLFMDLSWDGQDYHQRAVLRLLQGANFVSDFAPTKNIWVNHYTKATWYYAATLVEWFDRSEVGASYTFILAIAAGAYSYYFLRWAGQGPRLALMLSLMVIFNPVNITQAYTYYNDAALGSLSVILFLSATILVKNRNKYDFLVFVLSSILAINVKASGFIFLGSAFVYIGLANWFLLSSFTKAVNKTIGAFVIFLIMGIGVIGYSPYIQNLSHGKHFFYPLAGEGAVDIMTNNAPFGFTENNRYYNVLMSVFSQSSNIAAANGNETPLLKVPGYIASTELDPFLTADTRIGGFGPLYSVIFVLGIVMLLALRLNWTIAGPLFFMILLSILINPHAWWARYSPVMWLLPAVPLFGFKAFRSNYSGLVIAIFLVVTTANIGLILNRWLSYFPKVNAMIEERTTLLAGKEIKIYSGTFIVDLQLKRFGLQYTTVTEDYYQKHKESFAQLWGGVEYQKQ